MNEKHLRMPLTIHLTGPAVERHRLPIDQLNLFSGQLQVAVHRIGRILSGEAISLTPGPIPREVREACTLEIVAINSGSLSLVCDLPIDTTTKTPEQLTLFEMSTADSKSELGERSLEAFVIGISNVGAESATLPEGFDKGVLLALRESGKLFSLGVEKIDFELQNNKNKIKAIRSSYTPKIYERIIARIQEPVINKATIEGRLLMGDFRVSAYQCRIHPLIGKPIRCTFEDEQKEAILSALTRQVKVLGTSTEVDGEIKSFKVEDIEILDTEQFASGEEFHPFFDGVIDLDALAAEQGVIRAANLDQIATDFWPADEKCDDFLDAMRSWRREDLPNAS